MFFELHFHSHHFCLQNYDALKSFQHCILNITLAVEVHLSTYMLKYYNCVLGNLYQMCLPLRQRQTIDVVPLRQLQTEV